MPADIAWLIAHFSHPQGSRSLTIFEHVSVFISIILGLAVVHLLGGVSLILDTRVRTKTYSVHLLWTLNMLFLIVLVWLGNFVLAPVAEFSAAHFFNLLAYSMVIYLMSGLLYPVRGEEVTDFRKHYHSNRLRFFALGVVFVITDALDGLLEARATGLDLNPFQFGQLGIFLVLFVIGLKNDREGFHQAVAVVFFLGMLGFLYSLTQIGVVG